MATLKEVIGDLFTPEIEAKIGKTVVYLWNKEDEKAKDQEPIPKFRVNEMLETSKSKAESLATQITTLETQAKDYDKQLKDLKKAAEGNTDLVKQITELQDGNKKQKEDFELEKVSLTKKELNSQKHLAILENLMDSVYESDARKLLALKIETDLGIDKIEVDDKGKVKDFENILKPIKENKAFAPMFGETKARGQAHIQGDFNTEGDYFTREQILSMSTEQMSDPKVLDKVNKSLAVIGKK